jgi:hypothetical protein
VGLESDRGRPFDQELAVKKYQVALMLSVMAAAPAFSRADSTPANAGAIGAEQAVFDFCSKVLPARDVNFDKQAKQLVAGLSRDAIDNLRESAVYLQGYKVLQSVLREFSGANAGASCQAIVN